jgi:hypothetical protein
MAIRSIPYFHPMYSPVSVAQRQTRVGVPPEEETNQMSVWSHPEGTSVPLSIGGGVSLVTLDWGVPDATLSHMRFTMVLQNRPTWTL